jgi:formylglycine-generating enzyme required for sulfatase activity
MTRRITLISVLVAALTVGVAVLATGQSRVAEPAKMVDAAPAVAEAPVVGSGDTLSMVKIPGGTFTMGCVSGDRCGDDEKPAHRVTVNSYWMDEHLVTAREFEKCVSAGVCQAAATSGAEADRPFYNWGKSDRADHPINGVDWNAANAYCSWQGKRLPTEAEYEFALRGGSEGNRYPWGNSETPPPGYGNYADESRHRHLPHHFDYFHFFRGYDDGYVGTSPVCTFARNSYGLCDISGNVWEWCADWYDKDYYRSSPSRNPKGPSLGEARVMRGGSWDSDPREDHASGRYHLKPTDRCCRFGFRCVRD